MSDSRRFNKSNPEVRIGNYIIGETLGTGSFGKVKVGIHRSTQVKVAIKIVNREKIKALDVAGKLRREIQNLWLFRHPHIIKLYQVISTPTDIFMIMEYVSGGELFDHIVNSVKLGEKDARKFFQQIISGVDYCHRHKVVHRDLKPENLLLDSNQNVKIADFGLSNIMQDGEFLRTSCGSPNYAAPEVISGKLYAGPEVDIWSCGVILYALLCGTLPFDDENISSLFNKIKSGFFRMPDWLSPPVKELIKRMLTTDPIKRITIDEIKKHAWFLVDLPSHLFPKDRDEDASIIDKEAICEVCKACNVSEREVLAALITNDPSDQLSIAYHLIIDNKRFGSELNPDEVNNFYVATGSDNLPGAGTSLPSDDVMSSSLPVGVHNDRTTSPNNVRPHPERMPMGPCLTRTLEPIDNQGSRKISVSAFPGQTSNTSNSLTSGPNHTHVGPKVSSPGLGASINPPIGSSSSTSQNPTSPQSQSSITAVGGGGSQMMTPTSTSAMATSAATVAGMKRFKWHLGIRSQSKPWEIMHEVYKAMTSLGYEWKIINPYNIRVRKWNPVLNHYSKIMLQLYQVDNRSFLLDFKCIDDTQTLTSSNSIGDSNSDLRRKRSTNSSCLDQSHSLDMSDSWMPAQSDSGNLCPNAGSRKDSPASLSSGSLSKFPTSASFLQKQPATATPQRHQTMEFFEMCTQLITALAR